MTISIDKKVVEAVFENSQFNKNVDSSAKSIENLNKSLKLEGASTGFGNITKAAGQVSLGALANGIDNISSRFSALSIIGITTLANLTNAALNAGKRIVSALTIDPIKTGFNEYELKINAIQTIMAGSGESLGVVQKYLEELNEYSDRTIYSFSDMTQNIGKFTNAGVKLEDSVRSIKGIANVAALSGANANEAARAMYNFSQALSQGSVKLIDWKSIELANMGTAGFKQNIIDTALAMGTLTREADGTIKTLKGTSVSTKDFQYTLDDAWFTADVLTATLSKYTDETTDLGRAAIAAAQDVKTFTQLYSTLKEAAQSGWGQTWEIVVGDNEEAKKFLTELNTWMSGLLGASADVRNNLLKGWDSLGGRGALIETFENSINAVMNVINPLREALRDIFPPITSQRLFELTDGLRKFTESLIIGTEVSDKLKRVFKGVFAIFDIGKMALSAFADQLLILFNSYSGTAGNGLLNLLSNLGDSLVELRDSIKSGGVFISFFSNVGKVVKAAIDGIILFFSSFANGFKKTEKTAKSESIANFLETLSEKFEKFGKLGGVLSKVFGFLSKVAEKVGPILSALGSKIADLVNSLFDAMTRGLDKLDAESIISIINTGFTGGILVALNRLGKQAEKVALGGMFAGILLSFKNFIDSGGSILKNTAGILENVRAVLDSYQKSIKADAIKKIAIAVGILALSILALSFIKPEKLTVATAAIGSMLYGLMAAMSVFEKTTVGGKRLAIMVGSILALSLALIALSGAVLILGSMDPAAAAQGVLAVSAILGALLLFQKFNSGGKLASGSLSLIVFAGAMILFGKSLESIGNMDPKVLGQGLLGLGAALGVIALGMKALTGAMASSATLLIASAAIFVLATSFQLLGQLSLEQIGVALLAIAGAFTILGIAGAVLAPIAPVIAILAVSILAIGAAALAFGGGVAAIGIGIGSVIAAIIALSGVTAVGLAAITLVVTGLLSLIPRVATFLVKGIEAFVTQLAKSAPAIVLAWVTIGLEILKGLQEILPEVVNTVLEFVVSLLTGLKEKLPEIVQTGAEVLLGFLQGIRDNIGEITTVSLEIVTNYLDALASRLPEVIDAGQNLIISFIDGLAASMEKNIPRLMDAVSRLGKSIIDGLSQGIKDNLPSVLRTIFDIGGSIIAAFKNVLGIHSPARPAIEMGAFIDQGLAMGIRNNTQSIFSAVKELGSETVSMFNDVTKKITDALDMNLNLSPSIRPVLDLSSIENGTGRLGELFGSRTLDISATEQRTRNIVSPQDMEKQQDAGAVTGDNIQFIQNNYSPKELSRYDIYRQTRNQLRQLEGA